jgi:hypothetical protein
VLVLGARPADHNAAVPQMKSALKQSAEALEQLHRENEAFFKERGVR